MKNKSGDTPCRCGSGKTSDACCAPCLEKARAAQALDQETFEIMAARAAELGEDPVRLGLDVYQHIGDVDEARLQLIMPWAMNHLPVDGSVVRENVLADADGLTPPQRAWLEAQRGAWLSVWEVVSVTPGLKIMVADRLLDQERTVYEEAASEQLLPGVGVLARVVDFEGTSVFCGVHPQPLLSFSVGRVVEELRERLERVDVDELKTPDATRVLVEVWEAELGVGLERPLPAFFNEDGEELFIVSQRWAHDDRDAVLERLRALPDVEVDQDALSIHLHFLDDTVHADPAADSDDPFALLHHLGRTVAFASLTGQHLDLSANSKERADRIAAAIEEACGTLLRRVAHDVSTLQEMHER